MAFYSVEGPTIPAGQTLSEGVDCLGGRIIRILLPEEWDPAPLSFELSLDGENWRSLHQIQIVTGAFVSYEAVVPTVEPGSIITMPPDTGAMISQIRFRSGTKSQPIVQAAERKFQIILAGE